MLAGLLKGPTDRSDAEEEAAMTVVVVAGLGLQWPADPVQGLRGIVDVAQAHLHWGAPIPHWKKRRLLRVSFRVLRLPAPLRPETCRLCL